MKDSLLKSGPDMHKEFADVLNQQVSNGQVTVDDSKNGDTVMYFNAGACLDLMIAARDNSKYPMKALQVITGADYEDRIEVSYILGTFDPNNNHQVILKTKLPRDNPEIESVCEVWKAANFQERECYDMLGVKFTGHPDHRRILCPDDWEGFPLRKDYKAAEKYKHMTIYPAEKMNNPEREFVEVQKGNDSATRPELNWD
jgi:NADH-quinone oxidoreductase subunit C